MSAKLIKQLGRCLTEIISETNGISINETLDLACIAEFSRDNLQVKKAFNEFRRLLAGFQQNEVDIQTLLGHPVSDALRIFFKNFPLPYKEEHIHLTGSLTADFVYPRLRRLLDGPNRELYLNKIKQTYGEDVKLGCVEDIDDLLRLKEEEQFDRYLEILLLPKLILTDRDAHKEAAYHMASELYHSYNVGFIRLKFTFSRATSNDAEKIPGLDDLSEEDVVLGLYDGFKEFKKKVPSFNFVLSPCFRKEANFFDDSKYPSKKEHFNHQIDQILSIVERNPQLGPYLTDVDTVGNEKELYRKGHFQDMKMGFRKLHYKGFSIRSHHGETWHTLKKGVQAVDNSMNIWHIDTLEHGLSLGINPNFYYHSLYLRVLGKNEQKIAIKIKSQEWHELCEMDWREHTHIREKIFQGEPLTPEEKTIFVKTKFHTAREVEHYQHDVLNRMLTKGVSLIALPSSNNRLTGSFEDYKDHPFSWWEKKGVKLGVGTDNYITLDTDYIQELLILLYTDADHLKITKLLMVATKEERRPYISQLMWQMRK
ncbi:MAG: adenosine deaminase [Bacteriovoracaceae bacterium]|jgi:adenosine deaminase